MSSPRLREAIQGESSVGQATLSRFFAIHVVVLPLFTMAVLGLHLLSVQIHGMSQGVDRPGEKTEKFCKRKRDKHRSKDFLGSTRITSDSIHGTHSNEANTDTRTNEGNESDSLGERYEFHKEKEKEYMMTR